ncbi:MAG TPA: DUF1801 domain-containing protein [Hyphomonas sp.]|nr:DUF1801 domain-containing protein [Hyphomonas sp.]MCA8905910.1 DUF1801 domain-containing protein [Hyphomonas sp.]MCB9962365.1 DUF1801 domain-containing protein [Hyphomonas sp.]MCB9972876.1 DUF1801 domain-containing protein [Hyphomonas sp.]HPE47335.1 DUF1801 domain-containing protein [Hyphomonas sp.]
MAKADNRTKPTEVAPEAFIAAVENKQRRADAEVLLDWFRNVTGLVPRMWGPSLIGYGRYHYTYDTGREGEMFLTGFSPRKANLVIYVMPGYKFETMKEKLARLGKHRLGKSCLYINKLSDIDMDVLREIVTDGVHYMRAKYETWDE